MQILFTLVLVLFRYVSSAPVCDTDARRSAAKSKLTSKGLLLTILIPFRYWCVILDSKDLRKYYGPWNILG